MKALLAATLLVLSVIREARAEGFYLGGLMGADIGTTPALSLAFSGGGVLGYKVLPFLGLGVFSTYFGSNSSGTTYAQTNLAPELNFFSGRFHFGLDVGIAFLSAATPGTTTITSTTAIYGPEVGYDIMLLDYLSVGLEAHLYFSSPEGSFAFNIEPLAALKIWL